MMPYNYFKAFVLLILFGLFLWLGIVNPMAKYLSKKTSIQILSYDMKETLYPSMSVCKKYTFSNYLEPVMLSNKSTYANVANLIESNLWTRDKVFFFLNHPGELNYKSLMSVFLFSFQKRKTEPSQ